jgi:secreted PhoX family phosphatase
VPDPDRILDLPEGFRYRIISTAGERMDDGFYVPTSHDGMAAFPGEDGRVILIRNHEVNPGRPHADGPFGVDGTLQSKLQSSQIYDPGLQGLPALGGTTTIVFNPETEEVERHFLSLTGTLRNCAGGPTPWGSWISCEESTVRSGDDFMRDHGYCFEVPARAEPGVTNPVPLKSMGRFNHEAVAVDPATGIVFLTEDREDSLIYRFIPESPEKLVRGGRLQALAVVDRPSLDTRNWSNPRISVGEELPLRWIDLDDIEAPDDDLRLRGFDAGAARFARGEGMWYGHGAVYFACTSGGANHSGQVWKLDPAKEVLQLFIEPNNTEILKSCDNLTVAPSGDLFLCEDRDDGARIVHVTPEGECSDFARNSYSSSELAGATFSPDGSVLFVNSQWDGRTLAIMGPFG